MKKFMIVHILIGSFFLLMSGCSLQTTVPAIKKYTLSVIPKVEVVTGSKYTDKVIRMGVVESSPLLTGTTIYYSSDDAQSYSYTKSRWNESIATQLNRLIAHTLSKGGMFKDVIPFRSLAKNDLIFEVNIYDLSQVIHDDGTSTMHIAIKLRVVEQYSRKILATKLFEKEITEKEGNVKGALAGYNKLVSELLQEIQVWLKAECLH